MENSIPSQNEQRFARNLINAAVASGRLSDAGLAYLTLALDPWHDTQVAGFIGVPDFQTGNSVTCSIVQEVQIARPASIAAGPWDCRITTWPVETTANFSPADYKANTFVENGAGTPTCCMAAVTIDFRAAGTPFIPLGDLPGANGSKQLNVPSNFTKGNHKVAGMGVEVINTTAELYKQGLCTISRMNQSTDTNFTANVYNSAGTSHMCATLAPVRIPPYDLAAMVLLPGTCSWHASEGAYSVVALKDVGTRSDLVMPRYPMVFTTDLSVGGIPIPVQTNGALLPDLAGGGAPYSVFFDNNPGHLPMETTTIMFSGLSDQTTLTVRSRFLIERYPTIAEGDLIVLATPTASFDPFALEVYTKVMNSMPPGVKFTENPTGEWWARVLGGLAEVVGPLLAFIPHPAAKIAATAVTAGGMLAQDYAKNVKSDKKKKKAKKAKNAVKTIIPAPAKAPNQRPLPPNPKKKVA